MQRITGGIVKPKGFLASALWCGIKGGRKNDLCLIYSKVPAKAAGVFTANKVKGAPLFISKRNLKNGIAQAVIVNSGNANCLTGRRGVDDAEEIIKNTAQALSIKKYNVLAASTGVIGKRLPLSKIVSAVPKLASLLGSASSEDVAKALMTTDTVAKKAAVCFEIGSKIVTIGAAAKGAGMIHPNMATMLVLITTDAAVTGAALRKALKESVDTTFNCITVDGDTSTNDCVFILANGLARNRPVMTSGREYALFKNALTTVCSMMAEKIIMDAEGATKFVTIKVEKAKSATEAKKAAYAVATSLLVKTALYGMDPNWGRIAAALGRSGADLDQNRLDIYLGWIKVLSKGAATNANRDALKKLFKKRTIEISAILNKGFGSATVYTSDISKKYVDINAHYTT